MTRKEEITHLLEKVWKHIDLLTDAMIQLEQKLVSSGLADEIPEPVDQNLIIPLRMNMRSLNLSGVYDEIKDDDLEVGGLS